MSTGYIFENLSIAGRTGKSLYCLRWICPRLAVSGIVINGQPMLLSYILIFTHPIGMAWQFAAYHRDSSKLSLFEDSRSQNIVQMTVPCFMIESISREYCVHLNRRSI